MSFSGIRRLLVLGATAGFALVVVGAAPTASDDKFPPPAQIFAVTYHAEGGTGVGFGLSAVGEGPAIAKTTMYVPAGYSLNLADAPGSRIGETYVAYLDGSGFSSGDGTVKTGDPATLPGDPAAQACAPGTHAAVWIASYKAGKQTGSVRFYVDPTAGAETSLGAFKLVACFVSPDDTPAGPYFIEFDVGIRTSVLTPPSARGSYVWRLFATPWIDGTTTPNTAATFEARSHVLVPHVLTEHAKYLPKSRQLVIGGRLVALGHPRRGRVWIAAGPPNGELRLLGRPRIRSNGSYALSVRVPEKRRARVLEVWVFRIEAPGLCPGSSTAPAGCVDESISPPASHQVRVRIPKLPPLRP
jgi:hypothetical protein